MTDKEYQSMTLAQMSAKRWRTAHAIASWQLRIPKGVEVKLDQKRNDCFTVTALPCACCGVTATIKKCHRSNIEELVDKPAAAEDSQPTVPCKPRDADTMAIEEALENCFLHVSAYRYNRACIRVRVIDRKFYGKSPTQRDNLVEKRLQTLTEAVQAQIFNLLTLYPGEVEANAAKRLSNDEFENPRATEL